jgi:crotonobetainyl-CoA:carnitine CoA-transferase CaiB-like acyl-CoA transferase
LRYHLTSPGAVLGGGLPGYNLYQTADGWVALAALEPHFWQRVLQALGLESATADDLAQIFAGRTAREWETWAEERDIPLAAVREP